MANKKAPPKPPPKGEQKDPKGKPVGKEGTKVAPAPKPEPLPEHKEFEEELEVRVEMTPTEYQMRSKEHAKLLRKIEDAIAELKEHNKEKREDIKALHVLADDILPDIEDGKRWQAKKCKVVKDWKKGTIVITDVKTGKVYESRKMSQEERQMELFPTTPDGKLVRKL